MKIKWKSLLKLNLSYNSIGDVGLVLILENLPNLHVLIASIFMST